MYKRKLSSLQKCMFMKARNNSQQTHTHCQKQDSSILYFLLVVEFCIKQYGCFYGISYEKMSKGNWLLARLLLVRYECVQQEKQRMYLWYKYKRTLKESKNSKWASRVSQTNTKCVRHRSVQWLWNIYT